MEMCRGFRKGRLGSRVAFVRALVCTLPSLILTSVYNLLVVAGRFAIRCFSGCYLKTKFPNPFRLKLISSDAVLKYLKLKR